MTNRETWAERVAEWKASGRTSTAYSEGKSFTAGGLRHWAYRLRTEKPPKPATPLLRIARVVRRPASRAEVARQVPAPRYAQEAATLGPGPEALVVECGAMRVAVRPGFDRGTLAAVLDVMATLGGGQ